ncbi:MAG: S8 family peptidase [Geminicoccales bacterium]
MATFVAISSHAQSNSPPKVIDNLATDRDAGPLYTGKVIVTLKPDQANAVSTMEESLNLTPGATEQISPDQTVIHVNQEEWQAAGDESEKAALVEETVRKLNELDEVESAIPDIRMLPHAQPDDPLYIYQWHYGMAAPGGIKLPTGWEHTVGGDDVVVAVLDTGILPDHPDIAGSGNILPGFDFISNIATANDGNGRDADSTDPGDAVPADFCGPGAPPEPNSWHGTHVAGTVGAGSTDNADGIAGTAWNVKILPVRVLGRCGGSSLDIADAIRWSAGLPVTGLPPNPNPAKVINMSLGGSAEACPPFYQSAIDDAAAAGALVVVSAGNRATDAANATPANCDRVFTVAASNLLGSIARYSNYGDHVDIMAPGGDVRRDDNEDGVGDGVLSMVAPADGSYAFYNGTSMAAPHVAGVAALGLSLDPTLSATDLANLMQISSKQRSVAQCWRGCGSGLLDASLFLDAIFSNIGSNLDAAVSNTDQ